MNLALPRRQTQPVHRTGLFGHAGRETLDPLHCYRVLKFTRNLKALELTSQALSDAVGPLCASLPADVQNAVDGRQVKDPSTSALKRFRLRYGFLTNGYKDEFYYWEVVILFRKTVFILFMVFMAPVSSGVQALCAMIMTITFTAVQLRYEPYYDDRLNMMEFISLVVQCFTIYLGLFYLTNTETDHSEHVLFKWLMFTLVLLSQLSFVAYFIHKIRDEAIIYAH